MLSKKKVNTVQGRQVDTEKAGGRVRALFLSSFEQTCVSFNRSSLTFWPAATRRWEPSSYCQGSLFKPAA